jgi:acyl-CoA dehydrogenase
MNIAWFGTEQQKKKYIPKMVSGEMIGAGAITEPEAGSDVSGIKTTAVRDGDHYILNGQKTFISLGPVCNIATVVTRMPGHGKHDMTIFLVEDGTPGFGKGKTFEKLGIRGSVTGELFFEDCRVPAENRLGDEGQGFRNTMKILDYTRIGIAAEGLGVAQAALELSVEYAKQRVQFGRPIADNQGVAFMIADMATELEAARMVNYEAAMMADRGVPYSKISAMAKLLASECAMKNATNGVQIFGGYGYMMDSPIQRVFRDAKVMTIFEGTSQIQRLVISRFLLRDK